MGLMSLLSFNLSAFTRRTPVTGMMTAPPQTSLATPAQSTRTSPQAMSGSQNHPVSNAPLFAHQQTELFNEGPPAKPGPLAVRPGCARAVKTNQRAGTHSNARAGRLVLSGRMSDVCAEIDRLIALEHGLLHTGMH